MPTYEIKSKDGSVYEIDAPDEQRAFDAFTKATSGQDNQSGSGVKQLKQSALAAPETESVTQQAARAILGGVPFSDRAMAGMQTLHDYLAGSGKTYDQNLADVRSANSRFADANPVANLAGNLVGGIAMPAGAFGLAARGASMGGKVLRGIAAGVPLGAIQGASQSSDLTDVGETAKETAIGAGVGGLLGGTIPLAAKATGQVYSGVRGLLSRGPEGISKGAAKLLYPAIEADTAAGMRANSRRLGDQAMLADLGDSTLGTLQGLVLNSPEAKTAAYGALRNRNNLANQTIQRDFDNVLGRAEDPLMASERIAAERSRVDSLNYPAAKSAAPSLDITHIIDDVSQGIDKTARGTNERKALESVLKMLQRKEKDGTLTAQDDVNIIHDIRQEIDNVIEHGTPGLGVPATVLQKTQGRLKTVRNQIDEVLKNDVPGFREADIASARLANRQDAVKRGTQVLDSGKTAMTPERLNIEYAGMEPGERAAFAKGARGEIDRLIRNRANDIEAGKNIIKGEGDWNRDRLSTVFGQQAADDVINSIERQIKFRDTYNKVVENSQTAQRQAAAKAIKPEPTSEIINPNMTLSGAVGTAGKKAAQWIADSMRRDPTERFGEAARVLTAQGAEREKNLQSLLNALARQRQFDSQANVFGNRSAIGLAALANALENEQRRRERQ